MKLKDLIFGGTSQVTTRETDVGEPDWAAMRDEAERKVLAGKDARRAEFVAEYEEDRAMYAVEAVRRGDFLSLTITRAKAVKPSIIDEDQRTVRPVSRQFDVNLRLVTSIVVQAGRPVEDTGTVPYYKLGDGYYLNGPQNNTRVGASEPTVQPGNRPVYAGDVSGSYSGADGFVGFSYGHVWPSTENYPAPARDDLIVLTGAGTVYAPAGKGEEVREIILAAIERGAYTSTHATP